MRSSHNVLCRLRPPSYCSLRWRRGEREFYHRTGAGGPNRKGRLTGPAESPRRGNPPPAARPSGFPGTAPSRWPRPLLDGAAAQVTFQAFRRQKRHPSGQVATPVPAADGYLRRKPAGSVRALERMNLRQAKGRLFRDAPFCCPSPGANCRDGLELPGSTPSGVRIWRSSMSPRP